MKRALSVLLLILLGCDSGEKPAPEVTAPSTQPLIGFDISAIVPLNARRRTHIAVDSRSNVYWTQETKEGDDEEDIVFGVGEGGIPDPIGQLSSRSLLSTLKQTGGNGSIQSMVIGADDNIYVYFTGGRGATFVAGLIRYSTDDKTVRVLASTDQLMRDTQMGKSLSLARGTLLVSGADLLFWVRHTDAWAVLRVVAPTSLARTTEIRKQFDSIRLSEKNTLASGQASLPSPLTMKLNSDQEELSAGTDQKLYYIDRERGLLWQIDAQRGTAMVSHSLQGFPQMLTPPVFDKAMHLTLFGGDSEPFNLPDAGDQDAKLVGLQYPAVLTFDGPRPSDKLTVINRNSLHAALNVQLQRIAPTSVAYERGKGNFIVFDGATGQLLRFKTLGDGPTPGK